MVEHPLGKGEVVSSILTGSTIFLKQVANGGSVIAVWSAAGASHDLPLVATSIGLFCFSLLAHPIEAHDFLCRFGQQPLEAGEALRNLACRG